MIQVPQKLISKLLREREPILNFVYRKNYYVYIVYDEKESSVLYVGQTCHVLTRIKSHINNLNLDIYNVTVSVMEVEDVSDAMNLEYALIKSLCPKHNKVFKNKT